MGGKPQIVLNWPKSTMKRFLGVNQFFFVKSNVLILLMELFHLKLSNNSLFLSF